MDVHIVNLRALPQLVSTVAAWHHAEWLKGRAQHSEKMLDGVSDVLEREHSLRTHLEDAAVPTSFIACVNQQPLGSVSIVNYQFSREQQPRQWLTNLYVVDNFRGRGIALNLLRHGVQYAKDVGLKELSLYTRGLQHFYEKHGWQHSHRGIVQGQPVEVLKYTL